METKLTPEQQRLVEDNHNLIYSFIQLKRLDLDEWYDVCAIGLCHAAQKWNPARGKFTTIAYRAMLTAVDHTNVVQNKHYPQAQVYIDTPTPIGKDTFSNLIPYDEDFSSVEVDEFKARAFSFLTCSQRDCIQGRLSGMTDDAIARKLKTSKHAIQTHISLARRKIREMVDCGVYA